MLTHENKQLKKTQSNSSYFIGDTICSLPFQSISLDMYGNIAGCYDVARVFCINILITF